MACICEANHATWLAKSSLISLKGVSPTKTKNTQEQAVFLLPRKDFEYVKAI